MANRELPDTSSWLPRETAQETIRSSFLHRATAIEKQILLRSDAERGMTIDNFDSGSGIEDIVRSELRTILPERYGVHKGVVVDRNGKTCGDCDLLLTNDLWFPQVKAGATVTSRRAFFPIESLYGIGEIKQTLDEQTLDDAMRKLVITSRLERPKTKAKRLVENREGSSCSHGLSNPLYSFILATQLGPSVTFEGLVNRFFDVCSQLKRLETIRALTVLGHGTVVWGFRNRDSKELGPALFMLEDMYEPIVPIYQPATELNPALFTLLGNIFLHLFHSVLAPEDVVIAYGSRDYGVKAPTSEEVCIPPDSDLIDSLNDVCDEQNPWHHSINLWSDKH